LRVLKSIDLKRDCLATETLQVNSTTRFKGEPVLVCLILKVPARAVKQLYFEEGAYDNTGTGSPAIHS
jgi:hypothetical protein